MKPQVLLLGKEVKVGTRVRTREGMLYSVLNIQDGKYPFTIGDEDCPFTVDENGRWTVGFADELDVVKVLDTEGRPTTEDPSDTRTTELELKNYRLSLENELLAQEVQELRDWVNHLSTSLKEETGGLLLANHEKDLLNQEIARRDERIVRLERVLKGGS